MKHALTEMLRSEKIHKILNGDAHGVDNTADLVGDLMSAGHTSMKECAEVSFTLADQVVDAVVQAGASGARLIGGGFGGSVLVLVPAAAWRTSPQRPLGSLLTSVFWRSFPPLPPGHSSRVRNPPAVLADGNEICVAVDREGTINGRGDESGLQNDATVMIIKERSVCSVASGGDPHQ